MNKMLYKSGEWNISKPSCKNLQNIERNKTANACGELQSSASTEVVVYSKG